MRDHAKGSGGDGILSLKYFENGLHSGYDLLHLHSGRQCPFIRHQDHVPADWDAIAETGPWLFSAAAFLFAEQHILNNSAEPLYLDEAGPLEIIEKKGFYGVIRELIRDDRELYVSVREHLLEHFVETFSLTRSRICAIHLTEKRGKHD